MERLEDLKNIQELEFQDKEQFHVSRPSTYRQLYHPYRDFLLLIISFLFAILVNLKQSPNRDRTAGSRGLKTNV